MRDIGVWMALGLGRLFTSCKWYNRKDIDGPLKGRLIVPGSTVYDGWRTIPGWWNLVSGWP